MPVSVAQSVSLDQVIAATGITEIETGLAVTAQRDPSSGVYLLQAEDCTDAGQDSFEIVFDRRIEHIYGLGSKRPEDRPAVGDFQDQRFSVGHYNFAPQPWEADAGRMRTPIFVLPSEALIVAYMQPHVKQVSLSRTSGSTTIMMRTRQDDPEAGCAPYLIAKGANDSIAAAYASMYAYLTGVSGAWKRPHWNAFGLGWETFPAIGCDTSLAKVRTAYQAYVDNDIRLSFLIIGSGYWNSNNITGCGPSAHRDVDDPTMDALAVNPNFVSTAVLDAFFEQLASQGVYPMLGMRHTVPPRNVPTIEALLQSAGQPFLDDTLYFGGEPSNDVRVLNLASAPVMERYIELLHTAYGSFKGIKEDEMLIGDQKAFAPTIDENPDNVQTFADGTVRAVYNQYTRVHDGDFIVDGRNDWFSVFTDIQNGPGYIPGRTPSGYYLKDEIDAALVMVASGYPHPKIELHRPQNGDQLEILRGVQALTFMPVTSQSMNFTNIGDPDMRAAAIFFTRYRTLLHQYAFDHAQNWYRSGVPSLMKPLFLDYPGDERVYELYNGPVGPARNQWMMGNALLVRPILSGSDTLQTYLPEGSWKPLLKPAAAVSGGRTVTYTLQGLNDFPVLAKQGEIFVLGAGDGSNELSASVYLEAAASRPYTLHGRNGEVLMELIAQQSGDDVVFVDTISRKRATAALDENGFWTVELSALAPVATPTPTPPPTPTPTPPPPTFRNWLPGVSN